jgi:hypothetical protein
VCFVGQFFIAPSSWAKPSLLGPGLARVEESAIAATSGRSKREQHRAAVLPYKTMPTCNGILSDDWPTLYQALRAPRSLL